MSKTLDELMHAATTGTYRVMVRSVDATKGPLKNGWFGSPMYRTGASLVGAVGAAVTMADLGEVVEIRMVPMDGDSLVWVAADGAQTR